MKYNLNLYNCFRRYSIKYRVAKVMLSLVILLLGGFIYVIFRDKSLLMFNWFNTIGVGNEVDGLRRLFQGEGIYGWVKNSLPDGLWLFSYMFIIDAIWGKSKSISFYLFISLLPLIAIISEFLQFFDLCPGTFDWVDVASYLFAILLYITIKLLK